MRATRSRSTRRAAPSFEPPAAESTARTGWVYRSDAEAAQPAAFPIEASVIVPPVRRAVVRERRPVTYSVQPPVQRSTSWIETGFHLVTLPMTLTFDVMRMPVDWLFGSRRR